MGRQVDQLGTACLRMCVSCRKWRNRRRRFEMSESHYCRTVLEDAPSPLVVRRLIIKEHSLCFCIPGIAIDALHGRLVRRKPYPHDVSTSVMVSLLFNLEYLSIATQATP
mmetsp:Transcript_83074/g.165877  ORF Transcript_83074/g.165877 Transcript_83074/m.165877 type:complete len:110 (-) Transcript_83074:2052-2381(-)